MQTANPITSHEEREKHQIRLNPRQEEEYRR